MMTAVASLLHHHLDASLHRDVEAGLADLVELSDLADGDKPCAGGGYLGGSQNITVGRGESQDEGGEEEHWKNCHCVARSMRDTNCEVRSLRVVGIGTSEKQILRLVA